MDNIIRIQKDRANPYLVVSKQLTEDSTLSYAARGLMCYLLSKPDNWQVRMTDLENSTTDGRQRVRSIFRELQDHGYVRRVSKRDSKTKQFYYETTVYESPLPAIEETVDASSACREPQTASRPRVVERHSESSAPSTHSNVSDANASNTPDGVRQPKQPKQRSPEQQAQDKMRRELRQYFQDKTQLKYPTGTSKKGVAELWWNPIREIARLCDYRLDLAQKAIDVTLSRMRELTISSPKSILNVVRSVTAEWERNGVKDHPMQEQGASSVSSQREMMQEKGYPTGFEQRWG